MSIPGLPVDLSIAGFSGLAATNAMALGGIKVGDNLLAVISHDPATGITLGRAVSDFTVGAGTITAGTIDLSGENGYAIWTQAPAS